jgi:hypothetical protein
MMYRRRMKMAASDLVSSDMMSLETRQRMWQARLDPRRQILPSASTLMYEIAGAFLCAAHRAQRAASRRRHRRRAASVGFRHHAAGGRYARLHRVWNGHRQHLIARLVAKGVPQRPEDAFFLGCKDLYALLANDRANSLTEAKISVRSRNFELMRSKQAKPPAHMRRGRPVVFASKSSSGDGVFRCVGTSRSRVRARAPIVTELRNIGQLTEGEILVTQSTDPGRRRNNQHRTARHNSWRRCEQHDGAIQALHKKMGEGA